MKHQAKLQGSVEQMAYLRALDIVQLLDLCLQAREVVITILHVGHCRPEVVWGGNLQHTS